MCLKRSRLPQNSSGNAKKILHSPFILDSDFENKTYEPLLRNDEERSHESVWLRPLEDKKRVINTS